MQKVSVNSMGVLSCNSIVKLRNKSWKPECVGSFDMGWRIKFTNIRQPMLNKGNNKITELRTILQRESQNS
jgi:hypothetical protein